MVEVDPSSRIRVELLVQLVGSVVDNERTKRRWRSGLNYCDINSFEVRPSFREVGLGQFASNGVIRGELHVDGFEGTVLPTLVGREGNGAGLGYPNQACDRVGGAAKKDGLQIEGLEIVVVDDESRRASEKGPGD